MRSLVVVAMVVVGCEGAEVATSESRVALPSLLDFPRTFVGHPTAATLVLRNEGRVGRTFLFESDPPFAVAASELAVAGGSLGELVVRFDPPAAGLYAGALRVSSDDETWSVGLDELAEDPPPCASEEACRESRFDPAAGGCVVTARAEGTACAHGCLASGRCRAGECVGPPRACDDGNPCTADGCDESGCVSVESTRQCPDPPAESCLAAVCDPDQGCGTATAPDGTRCGGWTCGAADICWGGRCLSARLPDGAPCDASGACGGRGECRAGTCRLVIDTLVEEWRYTPPRVSTVIFNGLLDDAGNHYWLECNGLSQCEVVSASPGGALRFREAIRLHATTRRLRGAGSEGPRAPMMLLGDQLLIGVSANFLEARRTSDGGRAWLVDLVPAYERARGSPLPDELQPIAIDALAADGQGGFYALLHATGRHEPNYGEQDWPVNVKVIAFSADGTARWWADRDTTGEWPSSSLVSDGEGNVYFGRLDGVVALTRDGLVRWVGHSFVFRGPAVITGGRLIDPGNQVIFRLADGVDLWTRIASAVVGRDGWAFGLRQAGQWPDEDSLSDAPFQRGSFGHQEARATAWNVETGALAWDRAAEATTAALTSRDTLAVIELGSREFPPEFRELMVTDGSTALWCELPPAAYQGPLTLGRDRVIVTSVTWDPEARREVRTIHSFRAPGIEISPTGWSGERGNMQRDNHAR